MNPTINKQEKKIPEFSRLALYLFVDPPDVNGD